MSIKKARKTLQNKEKFNYDILDKVANSGRNAASGKKRKEEAAAQAALEREEGSQERKD